MRGRNELIWRYRRLFGVEKIRIGFIVIQWRRVEAGYRESRDGPAATVALPEAAVVDWPNRCGGVCVVGDSEQFGAIRRERGPAAAAARHHHRLVPSRNQWHGSAVSVY